MKLSSIAVPAPTLSNWTCTSTASASHVPWVMVWSYAHRLGRQRTIWLLEALSWSQRRSAYLWHRWRLIHSVSGQSYWVHQLRYVLRKCRMDATLHGSVLMAQIDSNFLMESQSWSQALNGHCRWSHWSRTTWRTCGPSDWSSSSAGTQESRTSHCTRGPASSTDHQWMANLAQLRSR